jgi:hypothetical protein
VYSVRVSEISSKLQPQIISLKSLRTTVGHIRYLDRVSAMRLLTLDHDGDLNLIERTGKAIPQYAILSHTWGPDEEEVTYKDLMNGTKKDTPGYSKIKFCVEQANRDGLCYSWVDTCCDIQTHHRRQCPTKRVAYAAENGGL